MIHARAVATGERGLDCRHSRLLVIDLGVDLAGGDIARVLRQQLRQRPLLTPQRSQRVQCGEHSGVCPPEVPEVEVTGVLASENRTGLGHGRLDERVPDPGPHWRAASLAHDLRDSV